MGAESFLLVIILFLLLSMAIGNYVFVALGMAGVIGLFHMGIPSLNMIGPLIWKSITSEDLSAIPLFVFMGEIVLKSGLSSSFYQGISMWLAWLPGGLLHTNVAFCACFAAISGSSVATTAAIGTLALKQQMNLGYNRQLVLGSIAASGTLGILIPPSINMIVYGAWVECSIGQLFMGGVIPGIIMSLIFMLYIYTRVSLNPKLIPVGIHRGTSEVLGGVKGILPMVIIMGFIFITVYMGFMNPTETAAGSVSIAVIIALTWGRLNWKIIQESASAAIKTSCMILFIFVGAKILVYVVTFSGVPSRLPQVIADLNLSPISVMLAIYLMYIILGCLMDGISMIVLTMPFVLPILLTFNIDLVWFGVILILLTEMGMLTPPVGLVLYVVLGLDKEITFREASLSILPFLGLQFVVLALLTVAPDIILWLPKTMIK